MSCQNTDSPSKLTDQIGDRGIETQKHGLNDKRQARKRTD